MNRALSKIIIILIFVLAGVLFFHNLTSINADIGRHIKLGEIIWQSKEVPKTNLFSFTAPDFPFINHHWLSEVIFYGIFNIGGGWLSGLQSVIIFKALVLLLTYFILYLTVRRHNIFAVFLSFLISIFVFSARTEPRPEIFSYLFFAIYLVIIYRAKLTTSDVQRTSDVQTLSWLWLLPLIQLFWVNMHIYFIMGPIIYLFFLIDRRIEFNGLKFWNWNLFRIWLAVIIANFFNPNFIAGALYPFKVLSKYGYSVVENSSLFFLAKYFGQWAPQDKLFLMSLFILAGSFVAYFWRNKLFKTRIFDLLLIIMTAALSFKMQRNIPLYALSLWPVLTENLNFVFETQYIKKFIRLFFIGAILILILSIYLVISGRFYRFLDSSKMFGFGVSSAAQDGTNFVKENKIQGPVFNNFDIGSYLAWQLFSDQRVFVDGRPEAYPVEFFEDIYKLMQRDENVWEEKSKKYGINYVFFVHTDMTEWGGEFLARMAKDPEWPMVFLNDAVVVFLKNTPGNRPIINKHKITDENLDKKVTQVLDKLDTNDNNAFVNFGNALYRFRYLAGAAKIYEELIKNQPDNPYGYQGAGYAYASMNDLATQEKSAKNLEKAIALGFKTFNNYFTLGIIKANLGNYFAAEENITKALKIKPDNRNARQTLETISKKQRINFQ